MKFKAFVTVAGQGGQVEVTVKKNTETDQEDLIISAADAIAAMGVLVEELRRVFHPENEMLSVIGLRMEKVSDEVPANLDSSGYAIFVERVPIKRSKT